MTLKHIFNIQRLITIIIFFSSFFIVVSCEDEITPPGKEKTVPHVQRWGIYSMDISTEQVEFIFSSTKKISFLHVNSVGDRFVFSQQLDENGNEYEEICTVGTDGSNFKRLTENKIYFVGEWWE